MSKVNELLREYIEQKRRAYELATLKFNQTLDNKDHTQSELIQAAADFHEAQGEYNGAMNAWITLYEAGAI